MLDLAASVRDTGNVVNRTLSVEGLDLSISGAPLPATSPADEGTVLVAGVDLSEVRRAERALVQAQRLEAMGVVAGRVAHDFNNLLTLIIGYTELLARGLVDTQQQALRRRHRRGGPAGGSALTQQMLGMTRREGTAVVVDLGSELANLQAVLTRLAGPKVLLSIASPDGAGEGPGGSQRDRADRDQPGGQRLRRHGGRRPDRRDPRRGAGRSWTGPTAAEPARRRPDDRRQRTRACRRMSWPAAWSRSSRPSAGVRAADWACRPSTAWSPSAAATWTSTRTRPAPTVRIWLPLSEDAPAADRDEGEVWPPGQTIAGRILLVEDEPDLRLMAQQCLASIGLDVRGSRVGRDCPVPPQQRRGRSTPSSPTSCCPGCPASSWRTAVQRRHPRHAGAVHDRLRRVADCHAACRSRTPTFSASPTAPTPSGCGWRSCSGVRFRARSGSPRRVRW